MLPLAVMLMALLAEASSEEDRYKTIRLLRDSLGFGSCSLAGRPWSGGRTVLVFGDGSRMVQMLTRADMAAVGTSLSYYHLGGNAATVYVPGQQEVARGTARPGRGPLADAILGGHALGFAYVDAGGVPRSVVWLQKKDGGRFSARSYVRAEPGVYSPVTRLLGVPEDQVDKVLSFWLDLDLVESRDSLAAMAFGEPHLGSEVEKVEQWMGNEVQRNMLDLNYAEILFQYLAGNEAGADRDDLNAWSTGIENLQTAILNEAAILVEEISPLIEGLELRQARASAHVWRIFDPSSPEWLLDHHAYELFIVVLHPELPWLREHHVGPAGAWHHTFDTPLVYWELRKPSGQVLERVPYREGLLGLWRRHFGLDALVAQSKQSLLNDAQEVSDSTPRRWLVPPSVVTGR